MDNEIHFMGRYYMAHDLNLIQNTGITKPEQLFEFARSELVTGVKKSNHPFHLCTLATISNESAPDLRTVVSRHVESSLESIIIHSDKRAAKNRQIHHNPNVSLLYYSVPQKLQIRFTGQATVIDNGDENTRRFLESSPHAQICYAYPNAPGTSITNPTKEGLNPEINVKQIDAIKDIAHSNFSHIKTTIQTIDLLWLNRKGHVRVFGEKHNSDWLFKFIVA